MTTREPSIHPLAGIPMRGAQRLCNEQNPPTRCDGMGETPQAILELPPAAREVVDSQNAPESGDFSHQYGSGAGDRRQCPDAARETAALSAAADRLRLALGEVEEAARIDTRNVPEQYRMVLEVAQTACEDVKTMVWERMT